MWRGRGKWAKPMGLGYPRANASLWPPRRARAQEEIAPAGMLHADSGGIRLLPSPPHFSQKMLISVPSTWAARDHLTVPPLSITAAGAVSAAGGQGCPLLPLHGRGGNGPLALGPLSCRSDVATALSEHRVVFLACKATAPGERGQAPGPPGPQSSAERGPGSGRASPGGQRGLGASTRLSSRAGHQDARSARPSGRKELEEPRLGFQAPCCPSASSQGPPAKGKGGGRRRKAAERGCCLQPPALIDGGELEGSSRRFPPAPADAA